MEIKRILKNKKKKLILSSIYGTNKNSQNTFQTIRYNKYLRIYKRKKDKIENEFASTVENPSSSLEFLSPIKDFKNEFISKKRKSKIIKQMSQHFPRFLIPEKYYKNYILDEPIKWNNSETIQIKNWKKRLSPFQFNRNFSINQTLQCNNLNNTTQIKNNLFNSQEKVKISTSYIPDKEIESKINLSNPNIKILKSLDHTNSRLLDTNLKLTENHGEKINTKRILTDVTIKAKTSHYFYLNKTLNKKTYHELAIVPALTKLNYPSNNIV